MKAIVDADACIGCGLCPEICPDVYSMDGDKAVSTGEVPAELEDCARQAAGDCPVEAIAIQE